MNDASLKYMPEHERAELPESDFAGPGRTFPINSQEHVFSAAHLVGHASDPNEVRRRIIEIAKRKGYAIPESWQDLENRKSVVDYDTVISFGSAVKTLGDNRIGGWLVIHSDENSPDLVGDYFTKNTDYGPHRESMVLYDHALDGEMKRTVLGTVKIEVKDAGVWVEGVLDTRQKYCAEIMKLVEAGKLGWSSGTASHLVERERTGKSYHIKSWWLGLDASLTPTPCEPRTLAVPLKSYITEQGVLTASDFDEHTDKLITDCKVWLTHAEKLQSRKARDGRFVSQDRVDEFKTLSAQLEKLISLCGKSDYTSELNRLRLDMIATEHSLTINSL